MYESLAVVGATGAVGTLVRTLLEERAIPFKRIKFLASKRSAGKQVTFCGQSHPVEVLAPEALEDLKLAWAAELREAMNDGDPKYSAAQWAAFASSCGKIAGKLKAGDAPDAAAAETLAKEAGLASLDEFIGIRRDAVRLSSYLTAGGGMKHTLAQAKKMGIPAPPGHEETLANMKEGCADSGLAKGDMDCFLEHRGDLPDDLVAWTAKLAWVR